MNIPRLVTPPKRTLKASWEVTLNGKTYKCNNLDEILENLTTEERKNLDKLLNCF